MSSLLSQVLVYMSSTFVLGLLLGWVVWRHGSAEERKTLTLEMDFWKNRLDQARVKQDHDLNKIDTLTREKENLRKRLAAKAS